MLPSAVLSIGTLNMIEVKHTAVFLWWPFAGAGERAVWKQILGCPLAACCDNGPLFDKRTKLVLLGGGIFASIVR